MYIKVYSPFLFKMQSAQSALLDECLIAREIQVSKPFLIAPFALPARGYFESTLGADCLLNKNELYVRIYLDWKYSPS